MEEDGWIYSKLVFLRRYDKKFLLSRQTIYDNGTHYVTNQKLTLEMLKEISDHNDVIAVEGDYTEAITGLGSSHSWDEVRSRTAKR